MKEGLCEITVNMEIPGMTMPPQTYTQCITKKNLIPKKEEPNQKGCNTIKTEVNKDTVYWIMECKTKGGVVTSNGYITYKGNTFEGMTKIKHPGTDITQHLKGKWIGPCN
ncbi:MAG: DUF3617 family protein [Desulfobacterota bacterium]|nr:DUF3617 family protein [Thermodesulfobacteriota bacterium]